MNKNLNLNEEGVSLQDRLDSKKQTPSQKLPAVEAAMNGLLDSLQLPSATVTHCEGPRKVGGMSRGGMRATLRFKDTDGVTVTEIADALGRQHDLSVKVLKVTDPAGTEADGTIGDHKQVQVELSGYRWDDAIAVHTPKPTESEAALRKAVEKLDSPYVSQLDAAERAKIKQLATDGLGASLPYDVAAQNIRDWQVNGDRVTLELGSSPFGQEVAKGEETQKLEAALEEAAAAYTAAEQAYKDATAAREQAEKYKYKGDGSAYNYEELGQLDTTEREAREALDTAREAYYEAGKAARNSVHKGLWKELKLQELFNVVGKGRANRDGQVMNHPNNRTRAEDGSLENRTYKLTLSLDAFLKLCAAGEAANQAKLAEMREATNTQATTAGTPGGEKVVSIADARRKKQGAGKGTAIDKLAA